jgi:3-hydroxymyristoyl/3-hydroxydecanoyl-(acyl carrier protein) dehydratase
MEDKVWTTEQVSEILDIGTDFLFVSHITEDQDSAFVAMARDPGNLNLSAHFLKRQILPASIVIEFALQFSAFVVSRLMVAKTTPIIGDIRYRAMAPVTRLEGLVVELDSHRSMSSGSVISSTVTDQLRQPIGRSTLTYSVK